MIDDTSFKLNDGGGGVDDTGQTQTIIVAFEWAGGIVARIAGDVHKEAHAVENCQPDGIVTIAAAETGKAGLTIGVKPARAQSQGEEVIARPTAGVAHTVTLEGNL